MWLLQSVTLYSYSVKSTCQKKKKNPNYFSTEKPQPEFPALTMPFNLKPLDMSES